MDEQDRQEPQVEERQTFDRDRATALTRAIWRDFGPLIMGALVLLLVLVGGWYFWNRTRGNAQPSPVVVEETDENGQVSLPTSEITIPGQASPRPTPSASPTGSPRPSASPSALAKGTPQVATGTAATKGGQLPKTGLSLLPIAFFTALSGTGFVLHKLLRTRGM